MEAEFTKQLEELRERVQHNTHTTSHTPLKESLEDKFAALQQEMEDKLNTKMNHVSKQL